MCYSVRIAPESPVNCCRCHCPATGCLANFSKQRAPLCLNFFSFCCTHTTTSHSNPRTGAHRTVLTDCQSAVESVSVSCDFKLFKCLVFQLKNLFRQPLCVSPLRSPRSTAFSLSLNNQMLDFCLNDKRTVCFLSISSFSVGCPSFPRFSNFSLNSPNSSIVRFQFRSQF